MIVEEDEIKICRTTLNILKFTLVWPRKKHELRAGKSYYLSVFLLILLTAPWCLSVLLHLIATMMNNVDIKLGEDFSALVGFCGIFYTTLTFVKHQPKIAKLLQDLSDFRKFGQPPGFAKINSKLNFWSAFVYIYTVVGVTVFSSIKYSKKHKCELRNLQKGLDENCGFLTPIWAPWDINYYPVYQLVYLYVFFSGQLIRKLVLIISFLAMETTHHLVLRIRHMQEMVVECFDEECVLERRRKMRQCIEYHIEILKLAKRLNECFTQGMLAHLTMTGIICAFIEKQIVSNVGRFSAILHFSAWIAALSVACYGGQHLINASNLLPDKLCSSKWYRVDVGLQKELSLMLMVAQKPLVIRAGPFGVVSFPLLVSVLKMSYSVLCVLTS